MRVAYSLLDLIGGTPIVLLRNVAKGLQGEVWAKCEFMNPSGSVKDRIALYMIRDAERRGLIKPGMKLLIPTTGNTGIAFASIGAYLGYKVVIVIPEEMSSERILTLKALGAEIMYTPGGESDALKSLEYARRISMENPGEYYVFDQWSDEANVSAHYETTGCEIIKQIGLDIDAFTAGVGTGGTLIGVAKKLKEVNPKIKIYGVEPSECPTISQGLWGTHEIEGIGDGFTPEIIERYKYLIDGWILVSSSEAITTARRIACMEGLFVGISSGANVSAALRLVRDQNLRKVVTILPDYGSRYFSTKLVK